MRYILSQLACPPGRCAILVATAAVLALLSALPTCRRGTRARHSPDPDYQDPAARRC